MNPIKISLPVVAAFFIAGCGQSPTTSHSTTRLATPGMSFQANRVETAVVVKQAEHLNKLADDLVRKSTTRGAAIGAVVGCGLTVVSASNAKNCLTGAAAGAAGGALIGHAHGKRQVAKRVELVSASKLVVSIRKANKQLDGLRLSLPDILAQQDETLKSLEAKRTQGAISGEDYARGVNAIRAERAQLATALSASAEKAREAAKNIQQAADQGQQG